MALIKRMQTPPEQTRYQNYKPYLRIDFEYRCAYCKNREVKEGGSKKFHIDHFKPQKKFPLLICHYLNLFYACSECNGAKKDFWPSPLDLLLNRFFLNPCEDDFEKHYNMDRPEWRGNTKVAVWNIERLRLNSKRRITFRNDELIVCELIEKLECQRLEIEECLIKSKFTNIGKTSLENDLDSVKNQIATLKRMTISPLE